MTSSYLYFFITLTAIFRVNMGAMIAARFASGKDYTNFKLYSDNSTAVIAIYYYSGQIFSRIACAKQCLALPNCAAFNLYPSGALQVCQLLADNFCQKTLGNLYLQSAAGGIIYDKLTPQMQQSCFVQSLASTPTNQLCETLKPGCAGTWPECSDCVQSCKDCMSRYSKSGAYDCTIWPGGPSTKPIFAHCYDFVTYLMKKQVDVSTGAVTLNYMMAFSDMNRLVQLPVYTQLQFYFQDTAYQTYFGFYLNPYIDVNGTLSNITFSSSRPDPVVDSLNLNGAVLAPSPFISVVNDTNNCGSFWRLKASNPLNCPGGNVGLFGAVKITGGKVTDTGIHWPGAGQQILYYGDVSLVH